MSFYYDVIDWIGGYPYEYASRSQVKKIIEAKGFELVKVTKPPAPTGCNEFVFMSSK